ncbi:folylpolyglutamate synthase/dihydrofolate synthase family protein [uncultured Vagococcus sp.]|uniref:bifunctional folylpolyglutamate synthase/dihydrofolate synthase n=1 Tax=uncultured Vagococcus sp. TaxID=189676 RepID=UPI0028D146BB|nr:folylpolyglutamate synthase/dihydrofolate synthase family protein [uncultured Vagococcus sp.]
MTYMEALEWIHSRLPFGSRPGLERINALLDKLDNPQHKIKTVHVGGTNGKGSTVTFLRCLLEEAGLKVGTFTSPYITAFNERIAINNQPIPDKQLVALVEKFQPLVAELDKSTDLGGATEFEIITAMMFDYFYEEAVDVAIVEVGLGGTLDCTNVITPLISGITTIGLDHMDILGDTLPEIAHQKAGIIKAGRPIVTGNIPLEALNVLIASAKEKGSPLAQYQSDYRLNNPFSLGIKGESFDFVSHNLAAEGVNIPLIGQHQRDNAGLALEMFRQLGPDLGYDPTLIDFRRALLKAEWAGRMETISESPLVLIDGAHNEPAVQVLVDNLLLEFPNRKIYTIFAAIKPKAVEKMLQLLLTVPEMHLYLTTFDYPKAYNLTDYPIAGLEATELIPDWKKALVELKGQLTGDDVLLVTGSLYFISQVRSFLLE